MLIFSVSFQFYRMISEENPLTTSPALRPSHCRPSKRAQATDTFRHGPGPAVGTTKNLVTLLDLWVSSLRRGHANLLCIVPILSDDLRGESKKNGFPINNEPSKKA